MNDDEIIRHLEIIKAYLELNRGNIQQGATSMIEQLIGKIHNGTRP